VIGVLDRKLLRDIWSLRGQVLTIAPMIGAGVAVLTASVSAWLSLVHEQEAFYAETRFALSAPPCLHLGKAAELGERWRRSVDWPADPRHPKPRSRR
jgi:hypothetical protein